MAMRRLLNSLLGLGLAHWLPPDGLLLLAHFYVIPVLKFHTLTVSCGSKRRGDTFTYVFKMPPSFRANQLKLSLSATLKKKRSKQVKQTAVTQPL